MAGNMQFQYPEDRQFFADFLTDGDVERLESNYKEYFDFRHTAIKRWEFNKTRKKILSQLMEKYNGKCQYDIHPDCSKDGKFEPDHIVSLSTNDLEKKIRHTVRTSSEKVASQSFGSNDLKNLTLSCKRCNAFKKHHFILPKSFQHEA